MSPGTVPLQEIVGEFGFAYIHTAFSLAESKDQRRCWGLQTVSDPKSNQNFGVGQWYIVHLFSLIEEATYCSSPRHVRSQDLSILVPSE